MEDVIINIIEIDDNVDIAITEIAESVVINISEGGPGPKGDTGDAGAKGDTGDAGLMPTIAGATGQVQFNNAGALDAKPTVSIDPTSGALRLRGSDMKVLGGSVSDSTFINMYNSATGAIDFKNLSVNALSQFDGSLNILGGLSIATDFALLSGKYLGSGGGAKIYMYDAGTGNMILTPSTTGAFGKIRFNYGASSLEAMRVNNDGALLIGTTVTDASALLIIASTTKGILVPRLTTTQKNAIASPANGLIVFDTTLGALSIYSSTRAAWITALFDEDLKGGAASLKDRINTISNFASPNAGGVVSGQYYDNCFQGSASGTLAAAANRMDLAPYYTSVQLPIDRIGVAVSTAVAASLAKVVIYSSDANGWPGVLLYESADLDCSTTGMKEVTLSFTFNSGVKYWVGVRTNSTQTLRTVAVASSVNLGLTSSSASSYATILRRTLTYATPATSPWNFTNSDRTTNVTPPSIRFRAV